MKNLAILAIMLLFTGVASAQETTEKGLAVIQTSAECGSCKKRIEEKMNYTKGVKYAELDLETMKLEVKYNPDKITLAKIKKIISETGYDADEVKAIPEAVDKLPACCKPGGMKK